MADSLLTQALNAISNGEFTNPTQATSIPQAAPLQPDLKEVQVTDASQRINSDFAAKGQYPSLSGEIARFNQQAADREQVQNAMAEDLKKFVPITELESGSPVIQAGAQITNNLAGFGSSLARIALQLSNKGNLDTANAALSGTSDAERLAFNREQDATNEQNKANVARNALVAQDILSGTPGANAERIQAVDQIARQQTTYPGDKALLDRPTDEFSNTELYIPQYPGMPVQQRGGETVRQRLQRAQDALNETSKSLGNPNQGVDNEWGTDAWVNREASQRLAQRLEQENKGKSIPGAILNTVGEYLKNPSLVVQSASESLPYALGPIGIGAGTFGQAVQNQMEGYRGQAGGQLPTEEQIANVTELNALHSGLNFVENVVNARALGGLSNAALTAPLRRGGQAVADSAIGRTVADTLAGTGISRLANAAGRLAAPESVRELARTMVINGLTEAAQNQIETRNLLGDTSWDTEGNINAGVLGALSSGVMTGPSTVGRGAVEGIQTATANAARRARERAEATNPAAAETRQAAQDASKPFVDLTNPDHVDYNPQAAIRQQTNVFADSNTTPEARTEAVQRAQEVRDNAENQLASVRDEVAQVQKDEATRQAINERITELDQYEDSPAKAELAEKFNTMLASLDERTLTPEQQQDLVTRYDAATNNAERIRNAYSQFETAANLRTKESPTTVQDTVDTVSSPDATQTQVDDAANHVVTHPMQYSPEQLQSLASDTTNRFSDSQRTAIRALADARVAQNGLKTELRVNQDIMEGSKGYRSLGEYTSAFADAIRSGNTTLAGNLRDSLQRFQQSHEQKAALARQMIDTGNYGQMIRQNGQWVVNKGNKLKGINKTRNGALDIHKGSSGLVDRIQSEVEAIQATSSALDAMASARPTATATATQPSSPAQTVTPATDATATVQAQPEPAAVETGATEQPIITESTKPEPVAKAAPRKDDAHKPRTIKQQERIAPAEAQTQMEQAQENTSSELETPLASNADTDATVVSDQTTAVKSDENTKAEGSVTVLRPEGKSLDAARTEERTKPFAEQNLVLTGFVQLVREGFVNPLVTVPDFMSRIVQKADWNGKFTEVNRYLATPMDATQKAFIGMFTQFHSKVAGDIDTAIKLKQGKTKSGNNLADFRYQDFVQYLVNENGQLDENTKAAMTASMFSWLAENGNKLIATKEDLAGLFHMDSNEVSTEMFNRFSEIGSSQRAVVQSLGQRAYQMLGFKVLQDVDPNRAGRMQQALGMYAMHTLMKRGYLEQTTMSARDYADVITSGLDPQATQTKLAEFSREFLNGEPVAKSRVTFNFVRVPRKEVAGKLVPTDTIGRIVDASKGTKGIMSKLFSFDSSAVFPLTSKPGKFMQRTLGDFGQSVPSELAERLTKAQQQPYRVNESVVNTMTKIGTADEASLQHMMGVRTKAETPFMHDRDRIGQEAKNADILRALENGNEVISSLASDDLGQKQAIYMPLSVWSNNRVGVASNMLNPQGNKIHRIMVGMEAHQTDIALNQSPLDTDGKITEYGHYLLTVAQGMEEAPIKNSAGQDMPTVDKVTGATYLQGMQDYLNTPRVREAVQAMSRLIEGDATSKDIATVKDMVAEFGMGPQSFQALHTLALEAQARNAGADSVRVAIGGESDGVTNGPILTNILYGTADNDLLQRGGLYTADAGVTNVPQYREQGGQDYYQLLGAAQNKYWNQYFPLPAGKATTQNEAYRRAIDYISPGFGSRKKAKVLATPFNYGSGLDSLKRASARDAIDGVYSHIADIAEAYNQSKEDGDFLRNRLERAIQIVLNQSPSLAFKPPAFNGLGKTENLLSYTLPRDVEAAIMRVEMDTRGDASESAINDVAASYIKTRDTNTAITNAAYEVGRVLSDRVEANALAQAIQEGQVGSVNGQAVEGLSTSVKAKLSGELREASAIVTSATGSLSSNKLESGYVAAKASTSFQTNNPTTEVYGSFAESANPANTSITGTKNTTFKDYRSGAQVKDKTAPGVSTSALVVQGTDAAISTSVISQLPAQNFHDANLFGVKDMVKGAQVQNKAMWDAVTGYDSQLANTEAMVRSFKGVSDHASEQNFTASDWTNVAASLRQLAFKVGINSNYKDPIVPSVILGRTVHDAYNREVTKLETLKGIEYVNQYGYEGGEYQVTAADRKALDTKISTLRTARDKAVTEAETLGKTLASQITAGTTKQARESEKLDAAQRRQAVEEAASDSEPANTTTSQKNALERFLSSHKDGVVNAKDLMNFTVKALASGKTDGSALQTRMRTSYASLAKVLANTLPDNLTVNIISGTTNPKGVKGADMNPNARAWFYSDKNTNQINIKMDGPQAPGLEVVLHEMLHAATARALDAARRDRKANPALTEVVDRLESLRQEVEQSIAGHPEFAAAVRNIDELVSWGMTNPAFQQHLDSLQSSMYPRQRQGVRQRLGSMFKEFANTVLRAVYAFTGRKPSAEVMTATEALILDTAELLQTVDPKSGDNALNLQMASNTNAANNAGQYTHRQVFDSLASATAGKQNSPEFVNNLGSVIDNVSDKLFTQVRSELTADSQGYTPGQVWANALATGKAPYTTKALGAGFHMTDQEAFAIESIETAMAASLSSGFGTAVNRELRKSWEAARSRIKPEDFYDGNWNNATPADKAAAQAKWDHLFKLEASQSGQNRYLSQFAAMTLGHEETGKMMGFTSRIPDATGSATPFAKAAAAFSHAVNWASGALSRTNEGQLVNQKLQTLAEQLTQIELKNRDKSVGKIEEAFTYLSDLGESVGNKAWDALHATADANAIKNARSPIIRMAGSVTRLAAKRNLDGLTETVRQIRDLSNPNTADGWGAQILSDISNPDKVRSAFESLQRHTNLIEQRRRNLSEVTRSNVMEMFQDSGKYLTTEDKTAMSYSLLRTEAHSLLSTYSLSDVQNFIGNPKTRNTEISKLEQTVLAQPNGNDMVIRAKALGYYMVTGKATIPGMAKNAQAIASGAGTHYVTTALPDRNGAVVESIDHLASLYAMQYSNPTHLKATVDVMKREMPNQDNGIKALLNVHKVLSEDAASTLFQGNEISRIKGYIPEVTNPYHDVKIVDKGEGAELEAMGYQFVGMVPTDPTIPSLGEKAMYRTMDNGSQRYVSGAVSLTGNQRKGSTAIPNKKYQQGAGFTVADGSKAVYAAGQKRANMVASQFDPSTVKDTYMIPVFGTDGRILDFNYEMNATNRDTLLDRNNDFAHLLGQYAGQTFDKQNSPTQNRVVIDALHEDFKANYAVAPERYVAIGPMAKDARSREIWYMLPEHTRFEAQQIWGAGEPMQVRSDLVNLVFGFKKLSVANAFDKDAMDQNIAESLATTIFSSLTGNTGKSTAVKMERAIQEGMSLFKDIVVLRNVTTLSRNLLGNVALLKAYGVSPMDIIRDTKTALQAGLSYRKNMALLLKYQQQQRAGLGNFDQLEQRIIQLEDQIARNPLKGFIEEGTMPSIVDDVDTSDTAYTYASGLQRRVSGVTEKVPPSIRTAAKWAFVSKDTPLYKFLSNTAQFGDFTSKYVLYKYSMEKAENKLSHSEAIQRASDAFVNYDIPTSAELQYMNDMGLMMFTKYRLRIQRAMLTLMKERPGTALAQSILVSQFTNAPSALEPNIFTGFGDPFASSVLQLPGAATQPFPIKLILGSM